MPSSFETKFKKRFLALNKAQKEAVNAIEGPVVVIAGPGSGKTELLSLRVANIICSTDARPQNVLCLTFTDSGAVAMRKRLYGLIGDSAYRVPIHTFHNFSVDIIERFPEYFYDGANLSPADVIVQREVLQTLFDNLSRDNPIKKEHPEQGYIYLPAVHSAIGYLKKAGLTPEDFKVLLSENEKSFKKINNFLTKHLSARITKKDISYLKKHIPPFKKTRDFGLGKVPLYEYVFFHSLAKALAEAEHSGTQALSAWKSSWTSKDKEEKRVLKNFLSLPILYALQEVYRDYNEKMYCNGYYDFDDMLLQTISAFTKNQSLLSELQETYQYILVDEFQDTNDAQMRLLSLLIDAPVNEGRPNVMVVGDDDQAIFKFQGAEMGNFVRFIGSVRDPRIITLMLNYRSTPDILDASLSVIKKGEERLENIIPSISKALISSTSAKGKIAYSAFEGSAEEYTFVAEEIQRLSAKGTPFKNIAVIGRKHVFLERLAPYLYARKIPVSYERQQDVLKERHIKELITIARFLSSVGRNNIQEADNLLPEILSFPFWGIQRETIWEISLTAYKEEKRWLEVMRASRNAKVQEVARFLLNIAVRSLSEPLEYILDDLIGSHISLLPKSADEKPLRAKKTKKFTSPFREYYFSSQKFSEHRAEYLVFLSSLRVFIDALREHKKGLPLKIDDLISFVDLHQKNGIILTDKSPFVTGKDAVTLLTAHKAKGLEFEAVFVLHCLESVWAGKERALKISFPKNLSIVPSPDSDDDYIRLFYVAMTRAKRMLYLCSHTFDSRGRETFPLGFLSSSFSVSSIRAIQGGQISPPERFYQPVFVKDEKALLKPLLENYTMSVTHLNNYLNIFHGGPQFFLEQNLLRFPQAKTPSNAFGTAMHKAVEILYRSLRKNGKIPTLKKFITFFTKALSAERLSARDFRIEQQRGEKALTLFYARKKEKFHSDHLIEVNFRRQGVVENDVPLSGKIDKMIVSNKEIIVHDFKTGRVYSDWKGTTVYEKLRLRGYARQLAFYKILVEKSRDFHNYSVRNGVIEFLEPSRNTFQELSLEIDDELFQRTKALISAVYKKIMCLEFPDISQYKKNLQGVIDFEEDILKEY